MLLKLDKKRVKLKNHSTSKQYVDFCSKVGVQGVVDLSPEDVVVLGEGDQAELECKVGLKIRKIILERV